MNSLLFTHENGHAPAHSDFLLSGTVHKFTLNNDYSVQNDESLHRHCTNERRISKWDKKVRRDVIKMTAEDGERGGSSDVMEDCFTDEQLQQNSVHYCYCPGTVNFC